jgi:hypothetical protein
MSDGQARAQRCSVASIKGEQFFSYAMAQFANSAFLDVPAGPCATLAFAFDAQERDLVERIDYTKLSIELQAVDDSHRVPEPDMLRTQITVAIDNVTTADTISDKLWLLREKLALDAIDLPHESRQQTNAGVEENVSVVREAPAPVAKEDFGRHHYCVGSPIEGGEPCDKTIELPGGKLIRYECMFERLVFVKTTHDD